MRHTQMQILPFIKDFFFGVFAVVIGLTLGVLMLIASLFFIPLWDDFTHKK